MLKNPAGWLAIGVLAVATIVMVFFVMPRISADKQPIGAAINEAGKQIEAAVADGGKAAQELAEPTKPQEQAAATPAPAASTQPAPAQSTPAQSAAAAPSAATPSDVAKATTPTFDVLRVEPDGSTVIAGRAEPGTKLEVADSNSVLAKADVAAGGEFAAILDNPLPPGDHQLVLKSTGKDGKTIISEEVATISVPKMKGGELLAMVTKPGEASRLIATPSGANPAAAKTERVALPSQDAKEPAAVQSETPAVQPAPQIASTAPTTASDAVSPASTESSQKPDIQVTAVEIEGDRIFVAGIAKPQAKLRGFADDVLIGDTQAAANGHFVIDGKVPLAVGDHRIAVDHIGADGKALLRVAVPFNRPAGDQVAAVAAPVGQAAGGAALSPIDGGAFDKLRNQVARAHDILTGLYANGAIPSAEQLAAARSATSIALKSLTQYRLPSDAAEEARRIAGTVIEQAMAALTALEALPRDVAEFGKGLGDVGVLIASAVGPVVDAPRQQASAPSEVAASNAPAATSSDAARTIEQAPLTKSQNASVIIRRGDTLWQISRRVYGQGVRYTTIYLANEDKITNPDVIQPGQVFGVPDEALPDSEELHRKRLQNKS